MKKLSSLFVALVLVPCAFAQNTLIVPHQYATIQLAITAANNGDTVFVDQGTYQENLDVLGKDITIRSAYGAASTIIDGSGAAAPTVLYTTGSTRASIFDGFTVRGGSKAGTGPTGMGGGMRLEGSSPTIRNCVICNNTCGAYGAGIGGTDLGSGTVVSPLIEHCTICDNTASGVSYASGGGIAITGFNGSAASGQPEIRFCTFVNNTAQARGGAAYFGYNSNAIVDSCTFTGNETLNTSGNLDGGAAIFFALNAICTITNNRIWGNTSNSNGGGIKYFNVTGAQVVNNTIVNNVGGSIAAYANGGAFGLNVTSDVVNTICWGNGTPEFAFSGADRNGSPPTATVRYSDVEGGVAGINNISLPPQLLNANSGNHRLAASSPCLFAGDNSWPALPAVDFEGDTRPAGPAVDIGADELNLSGVYLYSDLATISVSAPADVTYSVAGGAGRAGSQFVVLFGVSGTDPGVDLFGMHLPLNIDFLTPLLSSIGGTLGVTGNGSSVFPFGGLALPPSLIGVTLSSAAVIVDSTPQITDFTNDENVLFGS